MCGIGVCCLFIFYVVIIGINVYYRIINVVLNDDKLRYLVRVFLIDLMLF